MPVLNPMTTVPVNWGPGMYETWNATKARKELVRTIGGRAFVEEAIPSHCALYRWHGFIGAATTMSADCQLMVVMVGAGAFTTMNTPHGGCEATTGNLINDSIYLETGDGTNPAHIYAAAYDCYFRAQFQLPNVANVRFRLGLYQDFNNWAGVQVDTGVDANLHFRTVNAAAATDVSLGAADTNWHEIHMFVSSTLAWLSLDGATAVASVTNIPVDDLLVFAYVETLVGAATKSARYREIKILQDAA